LVIPAIDQGVDFSVLGGTEQDPAFYAFAEKDVG